MASFNYLIDSPRTKDKKLRKTEQSLYLWITITRDNKIALRTEIKIKPTDWNFNTKSIRASNKRAPEMNALLDEMKANVRLAYLNNKDLPKKDVKKLLLPLVRSSVGLAVKTEVDVIPKLSQAIEAFVEENRGVLAESYLDGFQQVINFVQGKKNKNEEEVPEVSEVRDVAITEIGQEYVKGYRRWMITAAYENPTQRKHLKFIKKVLNSNEDYFELDGGYAKPKNVKVTKKKPFWITAEEAELLRVHTFQWEKRVDNKAVKSRIRDYGGIAHDKVDALLATKRVSPVWDQLFLELAVELPDFQSTIFCQKERVKDEFLFRYCTGIRHQDSDELLPHHFRLVEGVTYLDFTMLKNSRDFTMPISEQAVKILKKYNYYLPKISQQEKDRVIKICFEEVGMTGKSERVGYSGSTRNVEVMERFKRISTHTARRSFGRRWIDSGGDIDTLSEYFGHSSSTTTRAYIGWELEEYADRVQQINFFKPIN